MKDLLVVLLVLASTSYGFGQNVRIDETSTVSKLMEQYTERNQAKDELVGYRIQLIATTERRLMESTKRKFGQYFPHLRSKWNHKSPYYQVQAGAFATKQEALPELGRIKKKFPKAYLIVDRIEKNEILARL